MWEGVTEDELARYKHDQLWCFVDRCAFHAFWFAIGLLVGVLVF
jgi:hypothetical protein